MLGEGAQSFTTHFSQTRIPSLAVRAICPSRPHHPRQKYLLPPEEKPVFSVNERVTASLEHVSCRSREPTLTLIGRVVANATDAIASLATCWNDRRNVSRDDVTKHYEKQETLRQPRCFCF